MLVISVSHHQKSHGLLLHSPSAVFFYILLLLLFLLPLQYHYLHSFLGFSFQVLSRLFTPFLGQNDNKSYKTMTLKGGSGQACAACKYQRRRCTPECPLAPYFPPDQPKLFQNAHRLFGVSNILKILKKLDNEQKATAMWSIIYQANERDRDPVHGCLGKICQLRYQIWHLEQELHSVQARLEMCRQHHQQQQIPSNMPPHHDQHVASQLELGMAPPSNTIPLLNDHAAAVQAYNSTPGLAMNQHEAYSNNNSVAYNSTVFVDSKDHNNVGNPLWAQYPYSTINNSENNNNSSMAIESQMVIPLPLDIQQQVVQDYDEMPFFMDDRQSFMESKEACESSSEESVLKDTIQSFDHVANNELKSAAACFSLTSVAVSTDN